jgi:hypothetical protein
VSPRGLGINFRGPVLSSTASLCFRRVVPGTNSAERVAAGVSVVRWLVERGGLVVLATHDLHAAVLLEDALVSVHFSDQVDDRGITFDHRLRPGPAPRTNALDVLAHVGYPPQIVEQGRRIASLLTVDKVLPAASPPLTPLRDDGNSHQKLDFASAIAGPAGGLGRKRPRSPPVDCGRPPLLPAESGGLKCWAIAGNARLDQFTNSCDPTGSSAKVHPGNPGFWSHGGWHESAQAPRRSCSRDPGRRCAGTDSSARWLLPGTREAGSS